MSFLMMILDDHDVQGGWRQKGRAGPTTAFAAENAICIQPNQPGRGLLCL